MCKAVRVTVKVLNEYFLECIMTRISEELRIKAISTNVDEIKRNINFREADGKLRERTKLSICYSDVVGIRVLLFPHHCSANHIKNR